jgi:hypothetical protein
MNKARGLLIILAAAAGTAVAQVDPGVRPGGAGAGGPLPGLTANELAFFDAGLDDFAEAEGVGRYAAASINELKVKRIVSRPIQLVFKGENSRRGGCQIHCGFIKVTPESTT